MALDLAYCVAAILGLLVVLQASEGLDRRHEEQDGATGRFSRAASHQLELERSV
jgi:hypothetical protein